MTTPTHNNHEPGYPQLVDHYQLVGQLTWPDAWKATAKALATRSELPDRPTVYDPTRLRAIHRVDAGLARTAARMGGGWQFHPRTDTEFHQLMDCWEHGHTEHDTELDTGTGLGGEGHFVSHLLATFGRGRNRIEVARCKDCGLPVWATGIAYRAEDDPVAEWRLIWPRTTTHNTTATATDTEVAP